MAGAENLRERILEEARRQAQANIERAEKEAAQIIQAARQKAEDKSKSILEKAQREAEERRRRLISVAELEGRKQKLSTKQELIEEAFQKAVEKLNSLPDQRYREILTDMVISSVKSGDEEVIFSEKDRKRLGNKFIDNINKRLKGKGLKGDVKLSAETRDIDGGFILKKGNVEINNTFEALIRMRREELETEVVKVLFSTL